MRASLIQQNIYVYTNIRVYTYIRGFSPINAYVEGTCLIQGLFDKGNTLLSLIMRYEIILRIARAMEAAKKKKKSYTKIQATKTADMEKTNICCIEMLPSMFQWWPALPAYHVDIQAIKRLSYRGRPKG